LVWFGLVWFGLNLLLAEERDVLDAELLHEPEEQHAHAVPRAHRPQPRVHVAGSLGDLGVRQRPRCRGEGSGG
jgi:hypothetical protein